MPTIDFFLQKKRKTFFLNAKLWNWLQNWKLNSFSIQSVNVVSWKFGVLSAGFYMRKLYKYCANSCLRSFYWALKRDLKSFNWVLKLNFICITNLIEIYFSHNNKNIKIFIIKKIFFFFFQVCCYSDRVGVIVLENIF